MGNLEKLEISQNQHNRNQPGNDGVKKTLKTMAQQVLTATVLILTPTSQLHLTTQETPSLPPASLAWKIILKHPERGCWYENNKQLCVASNPLADQQKNSM